VCCDLLELFAGVTDGRVGPGRDHPVAAVLALAAAVVAGMKGYTAITGWVADVPPAILADLYLRSGAAPAPPPSKTTIWRVLTDADADRHQLCTGQLPVAFLARSRDSCSVRTSSSFARRLTATGAEPIVRSFSARSRRLR